MHGRHVVAHLARLDDLGVAVQAAQQRLGLVVPRRYVDPGEPVVTAEEHDDVVRRTLVRTVGVDEPDPHAPSVAPDDPAVQAGRLHSVKIAVVADVKQNFYDVIRRKEKITYAEQNLALVEELRRIAGQKGVSVAQIAIAWVAAQGKDIVPLVGARRRDRLTEALGSRGVTLSAADFAAIEKAVPKGAAAGARYPEALLKHMDSEK